MIILKYETKKALTADIGKPLLYEETSPFGPEYEENGSFVGCNRPTLTGMKREFYAKVTMENHLIKEVS